MNLTTFRNLAATGALAAVLLIPTWAYSQGIFGPQQVPYSGQIEQNGQKASGQKSLRFSFYEADTGGVSIWTEKHDGVALSKGRFTVKLGSATTIPDHVWVRPNLYLEVAVCVAAVCAEVAPGADPPADEPKLARQRMLAVPYARHAANGVPPGTIIAFGGDDDRLPPGWLLCNGNPYSREEYPRLFAAIGGYWGWPNDNEFYVPDLRGYFLRGKGSPVGGPDEQPNRAVGTVQGDDFKEHDHGIEWRVPSQSNHELPNKYPRIDLSYSPGRADTGRSDNSTSHGASPKGGFETRPKNKAVNYIIKY
jgi:hypothetical protein